MTNTLIKLYDRERHRLLGLAQEDVPPGEYAQPVFGAGDPAASVMLIGEAPGAEETKLGEPFVGKAGRQLADLFQLMGIQREAIYLTNTVKYRPVIRSERSVRNRTPERFEIEAALPLLGDEILIIKPKVIATLGNTPLKAVLQLAGEEAMTIGTVHGSCMNIQISGLTTMLFPLYHPASGIYNPKLKPLMEQDARKFGEHLVKQA